jgi:hypothetical protein
MVDVLIAEAIVTAGVSPPTQQKLLKEPVMKSTPRTRFLAVASLAIGAASFAFAADTPPSGDRPSASDTRSNTTNGTNTTDRQDRSTDLSSRTSTHDNANSPDHQAFSQLLGKTVDAALNGDVQQISQNFYQADQKRFDEGNKDQAQQQPDKQLQQASADLKKSFQEKYHQELSLADASTVFGSDFLRPAGDIGEGARPAGARIGGSQSDTGNLSSRSNTDNNHNTGNTGNTSSDRTAATPSDRSTSNGTASTATPSDRSASNGTGSAATPSDRATSNGTGSTATSADHSTAGHTGSAAGDVMPHTKTMTVPASHGLPAVTLSMVKQGSDWKLNVPDTLTPQRLQQNLTRELSRCNDMKAQWPQDANQAQKALAHHVLLAIMDQDSTRNGAAHEGTDINSRSGANRDRSTSSTPGADTGNRSTNDAGSTPTPRTSNR